MSELKIMIHLGKHLNIVNLLGACTEDLNKRELFIVVEYCRFGNLQKYLQKHRNQFISQINPDNDQIDFTIGRQTSECAAVHKGGGTPSPSHTTRASSDVGPNDYLDMHSPRSAVGHQQFSFSKQKSVRYTKEPRREITETSGATDVLCPSGNVDLERNESIYSRQLSLDSRASQSEAAWRSNMRGDYRMQEVEPLTTKDLICWAYQVSRGMDYLSSKKVMHGDLACRNILLAADNVVKICDFGLARQMCKSNDYQKKSDGPLPVKWLAIECIRDKIFSTQSDVWAFGVVLWEMFTLGKTPYPGMEFGDRFYKLLSDGYRMAKPDNAPRHIYKTMLECWDADPVKRPRFVELVGVFANLLQEGDKENYIHLEQRLYPSGGDIVHTNNYLNLMADPDFQSFVKAKPEENNGYLVPNIIRSVDESGYLIPKQMDKLTIKETEPLIHSSEDNQDNAINNYSRASNNTAQSHQRLHSEDSDITNPSQRSSCNSNNNCELMDMEDKVDRVVDLAVEDDFLATSEV